jgi:hypothetical protein
MSCDGLEWWVLEDAGPVLDQLDAAVEDAAVDHLEGDVGVAPKREQPQSDSG